MRFKDVFSIIGPPMIGPSSSHTAGAVRLGRIAHKLLGGSPEKAEITFYGSFAETYEGHGTDVAVVAGLMNYDTDDADIPRSLDIAQEAGIKIHFKTSKKAMPHPNTLHIQLVKASKEFDMTGASVGGGNVEVSAIDGFSVSLNGMYPTLVIWHQDRPGMIAAVTEILQHEQINISRMDVDRKGRNKEAMTVIECDQPFSERTLERVGAIPNVSDIRVIDLSPRS